MWFWFVPEPSEAKTSGKPTVTNKEHWKHGGASKKAGLRLSGRPAPPPPRDRFWVDFGSSFPRSVVKVANLCNEWGNTHHNQITKRQNVGSIVHQQC